MKRDVCALLLVAGLTAEAPIASAGPAVFRFHPVETSVERDVGVTVKGRIVDAAQNQPAPAVEIGEPHVDGSQDGLANAVLPAFFAPSLDYGVYSFRADFPFNRNCFELLACTHRERAGMEQHSRILAYRERRADQFQFKSILWPGLRDLANARSAHCSSS